MLDLQVAMLNRILFISLMVVMRISGLFSALDVEITSPKEGQVLQGNVQIIGTAAGEGFQSADLAYAYANSNSPTWFVIAKITQPVNVSLLSMWNTTTISDGDYQLKLTVHYQNGPDVQSVIQKVLVRNYTPVEVTPTILVTEASAASAATETPAPPESTPYPSNPAAMPLNSVNKSLKIGALIGIISLVGVGIYTALHKILRRR